MLRIPYNTQKGDIMNNNQKKLQLIKVLNKEFSVLCPEDEKADLLAAAVYLDKKMYDLRNTTKNIDLDRIAIIAALNITHELLELRQKITKPPKIQKSSDNLQKSTPFSAEEKTTSKELFADFL